MLLVVDLYEDFIDVQSVAVSSVLSLQPAGITRSEFYTPETYQFSSDSDASSSQEIFYISMAQIESIVEPDCVGYDLWRESVAFVCIHHRILPITAT